MVMRAEFQEKLKIIHRINSYLEEKSDDEIGAIFNQSSHLFIESVSDLDTAKRIKSNFTKMEEKFDYLLREIEGLDEEKFIYFYNISASARIKMENNIRAFSSRLSEFNDLLKSGGESPYLFKIDMDFYGNYESFINYYYITCSTFVLLKEKIDKELNPAFKDKNDSVDKLVQDLELYKNEASSKKTKDIYKRKYNDYKRTVEVYELYVMLLVCLSITLVLGQLFAHDFFDSLSTSNAFMIKLTIVALIATLFTYCFKQINFYRKISEQAYQTYMELEALPEFLTNLPQDKQHEIQADLAKRYFGQNLSDSIKEDSISIQEQAKANAEVLKSTSALLDVIKKQT